MLNSKVFDILRTLSSSELRQFGLYLKSPFLNKNNQIVKLFHLIIPYHPEYRHDKLSKEFLNIKLSGNKNSNDTYLRNIFSDLNVAAGNFLSYLNYRSENSFHSHLIKELFSRGIGKQFKEKLNSYGKIVEEQKFTLPDYYVEKLFLIEMQIQFGLDNKLIERLKQTEIESKYHYFLISIMETYSHYFIEQQRANIKHDFSFLKYLLEYVRKNISTFRKVPLIPIYYYLCTSLLNHFDEKYFLHSRQLFDKSKSGINYVDRRNINSLMLAYYNEKSRSDPERYAKEMLMIYIEMMDTNMLAQFRSRHMNLNAARNIIILCMRLDEKKLFKNFLKSSEKMIPEPKRKDMKFYATSLYNIMSGNFKEAMISMNEINFNNFLESVEDNIYFKTDIKKATLICFYELKYFENLLDQLESYRHFILYSRLIPKGMKNRNNEFLNFLRELTKLNFNFDEYKIDRLKERVSSSTKLDGYYKKWLLRKIEKLINGQDSER